MNPSVTETLSLSSFESAVALGLGIWPRGTVFLVAVSGGADSTAMAAALAALRQERNYKLHCLHVEHGIRSPEESWGDALAVKELCKNLDIPCYIVSISSGTILEMGRQGGLGLEGAARLVRHRVWNREARRIRARRILAAHTRDDLLETLLMRFLRGSGPGGLAGIPQERGRILRPLLGLTRIEVLNYLEARGISFRTDSTNGDIRYLRNRIRRELVPCLDALFPYWRKTVLALGETQGLTSEFLNREVQNRVHWAWDQGGISLHTPGDSFFTQPQVIREEGLFQGVDLLTAGIKKRRGRAALDRGFMPDSKGAAGKGGIIRTPRRAVLRLFTQGKVPSIDAGPVRIEKQGTSIVLASSTEGVYTPQSRGFALLIRKPGVYQLRGLQIICRPPPPLGSEGLGIPPQGRGPSLGEEQFFLAPLPLVFRPLYQDNDSIKGLDRLGYSGYTSSIVAEDRKGPAARIFLDKKEGIILLCREEGDDNLDLFFAFIIRFGGIDV